LNVRLSRLLAKKSTLKNKTKKIIIVMNEMKEPIESS